VTPPSADPAWRADERYARAALSFVAEPGDVVLGALMRSSTAAEVLALLRSGDGDIWPCPSGAYADGPPRVSCEQSPVAVRRTLDRMRSRLDRLPSPARLESWERGGLRLVCPGDPEWPTQLDDLGDSRPIVLWLSGSVDLRFACLRSVSVVGSRAATAYGTVVGTEIASDLAAGAVTVISGGAYGIDACAHRGALAAGGCTIAVLASGLSFGYPKGHFELFATISQIGLMVSECPPDHAPNRPGFLVRNRLIAALSPGTVIVEAALRSGALNTARHARQLNRQVMAVPGPVTSTQSAGCHDLIREWGAVCVTSAADVIELITPLDGQNAATERMPAVPPDQLDPVTESVLRTMTGRTGRGPATIATLAGVDLDTAMRSLGLLAAAGFVERCDNGWRARHAR
jgi:DNA processing protein